MNNNEKKTKREENNQKLYRFYLNHLMNEGVPPTLDEIAESEELGFGSRERARQLMERLVEDGYLIRIHYKQVWYRPLRGIWDWISR